MVSEFQDRKLNCCAICKTKRQLALRATDSGHLYFLCRAHAALDDLLAEKVRRVLEACHSPRP